jgi:hypothetical protein
MEPPGTEVSTAHGEEGTSLIRTGPEAEFLREWLQRPARLGRYALLCLGGVVLGAGVALFLTNGSILGVAFALFGGVLLALGAVQHVLLRHELTHWPLDALLFEDGIELVLSNGEIRASTWSDPNFSIALVSRRAPAPANREYLLIWMSEGKIPSVELSEAGFDALLQEATARRLDIDERRRGRGDVPSRWIWVKGGLGSTTLSLEAPTEGETPS